MLESIDPRALAALVVALFPAAPAFPSPQNPWSGHQLVSPNLRRHSFAQALPNESAVEVTAVVARVRIVGTAARTTLDVALRNPGGRPAEAELLLPVPMGAAVGSFQFEGGSAEATATLLPAEEARSTYDGIVARLRDPALLEFAGLAAVRSSVFPVPAGGTQRVRISYDEILVADAGRLDYVLPRTASLASDVPWTFAIEVQSEAGVATVYSPTHRLTRRGRGTTTVQLDVAGEDAREPGPFRVSVLTGSDGLSGSILACPEIDGPGGTFLLVAGLGAGRASARPIPREVTIVIDRSGSMAGEKFAQARLAALQVLEGLRAGERFRVVDYSDNVAAFSPEAVVKSADSMAAVRAYLERLTTGGGTNIGGALDEALRPAPSAEALGVVLFLTDGLPTVGEKSESGLRAKIAAANAHGRRVFPFGVGDDVNAPLLDALASTTRGSATYVRPREDIEVAVGGVFRRLEGPRLADLELRVLDPDGRPDTTTVRDLLPARLPDLFDGDQLVLLGRFTEARRLLIEVRGRAAGGSQVFQVRADLAAANPRNDFVPRLWAARRIAVLMDAIRQATGDGVRPEVAAADPRTRELADEVLRLSTRYGVLSEYTAFLALEGTKLGSWNELAAATRRNLVDLNLNNRSGAVAVNIGRNYNDQVATAQVNLRQQYWAANDERVAVGGQQPVVGGLALQRGRQWIDGQLLEKNESGALPVADVEVRLGSEAHRQLVDELVADRRNDLAALPGEVLLRHRGKIVRLVNDGGGSR